jgi:hypothetical protein
MEPGFKGKGQGDMTRAVSGPHQINKTASNNTSEVNEAVYQHLAHPLKRVITRCMDTALIGSTNRLHADRVADSISIL